ncbi:MAG: bifunctional oligoribonuclease/PAP phosphatase NrnA [Candidatus Berkelbacteria bacterium]
MGSFSNLKKLIEGTKSFVLICHESPDGDAVGSILAMAAMLRQKNKEVRMICADPVPEVFRFLGEHDQIVSTNGLHSLTVSQEETIIILDCGDLRRTKVEQMILDCKKNGNFVINIDHHPKNDLWRLADVNYVDDQASSTAEIVYRIVTGLGCDIDADVATYILCGIYTDTGGFQHSNTSEDVMKIVSKLLCCGARLKKISENISHEKSVSKLKIWGVAMDRLSINDEFGIAYSVLSKEDRLLSGASEDDLSGLINLLNTVPGTRATLLIYESENGTIMGSLRTERDDVDLSKLASLLGGGGHKKAAGFTIEGELSKVNNIWEIV